MIIEISKLTGGYSSQSVIHNLDLVVYEGEWLTLVGSNGSGKSTLLKLINRLLPIQQGSILLNGKSLDSISRKDISRQIAFLPQQQLVPLGITVQELIRLGRSPYQSWWQWELPNSDRPIIERVLTQTQLLKHRSRKVETLSGGERQRAFLALALAQEPNILLLDEPTTYLDIHYQLELLDLLKQLQKTEALTIITVLHDLNFAVRYSDRLAMLKHGQLRCLGPIAQVLTRENLQAVFEIDTELIHTTQGINIIPISSHPLKYSS